MTVAIKFENISKLYRLGEVGTGTLAHDLHRAWAKLRGKPDPFAKVGEVNDRTQSSPSSSRLAPSSSYVWALKDINFEVQQGEILGIIGRNGAGKSTLLKLLSRVTAPTTGSIKSRGRIASLLEVGTGFHPELTGRENIYLNGAILGMRRHEITKHLEEIVEFSGCAKYIDTPVKRYSSGMMVRLGFAVSAHLECEILIVDEVLAVGDAEFQRKCIGKMRDISNATGKTVLFVSHNMSSIERLCIKGVVLGDGRVKHVGGVADSVDKYLEMNLATESASKLRSNNERGGTGLARLRSVHIVSDSGEYLNAIRCSDRLNFVFIIENTTDNYLDDVSLGYSISTSRGEQLVVSYSDYEGQLFRLSPGLNKILVSTSLPFREGMYQVGFRMLVRFIEADWPQYPVFDLLLEGGNSSGLAVTPHSGRGTVILTNFWSVPQLTEQGAPEESC